ncbi:DUF2809 domain-containing protein [Pleurocapsa sp. CCALA 161]|uniref:ribosomal maturation YjgA family protein n=1 Tax=Pleurocapsa sp. CCALA 161 TaxID=2107688 RepID=UPI000D085377|nr:DUF2809 domain-containing protein [Pleurocapsa sp. CCALA 161]PSB07226.1 DUF2809 domain-containing protein [Pleurocapsa sp. CCALA 161]
MVQKLLVRRSLILLLLLLIVPLGIFSKAYGGIGQEWVKDYSGDVLYEIFWCLFVFWFIRPSKDRSKLRKIAVGVFVTTCMIEISQLWFDLVPVVIRSSFIWRMLLGAGFDWWDFPHYALGAFIGWWVIEQIAWLGKFE